MQNYFTRSQQWGLVTFMILDKLTLETFSLDSEESLIATERVYCNHGNSLFPVSRYYERRGRDAVLLCCYHVISFINVTSNISPKLFSLSSSTMRCPVFFRQVVVAEQSDTKWRPTFPIFTSLECSKVVASCSQTGAMALQWPHHGAKNLIKWAPETRKKSIVGNWIENKQKWRRIFYVALITLYSLFKI